MLVLPLQWETLKRLSKLTTHSPPESTTVCKSCPDPLACPALSLSPCGLFMGPSILACVYFWSNPDTFLATRSCQSQAAAIAGQIAGCALAKQTENCIFYEYRTLAHVIHSPHTHIRAHTRGHRWQIKYVNLQWEMRKKMANSNCKSQQSKPKPKPKPKTKRGSGKRNKLIENQ